MKILQINCVYGVGSTGKIVEEIHNSIMNADNESIICYGRGKKSNEPNIYKVSSELEAKTHSAFSRLFGVDFGYSPIATHHTISIIKKERPDVVHLHCLNGHFVNVYKLVKYLKKNKIPTVLTLHAEIMHTAGCEHAMECEKWKSGCYDCGKIRGYISHYFRDDAKHCYKLMKDAFDGFEKLTVVGVSQWLTDRAKQSAIFKDAKFVTINNGIDTQTFCYRDPYGLRKKLKIDVDKKIVLHVTPNFNSEIKGGKYVIELAKEMPDYQFVIVGFNGDKKMLPENVIPILHTDSKEELAQYYSLANCMICTSLRESLPTVCIEAVSCGCNVVAFNSGGIQDTIPREIGECIQCYNLDDFEKAIIKWVDININQEQKVIINQKNSSGYMSNKYIDLYKELL